MSIENRALTSCKVRMLKAEADYNLSRGNAKTKANKFQQVRMFRFIYDAVQYFINRPRWTHVTKALPAPGVDILMTIDMTIDNGKVYSGYLRDDGVFIADAFPDGCDHVNVMAWMPMPKPYEPEKEQNK